MSTVETRLFRRTMLGVLIAGMVAGLLAAACAEIPNPTRYTVIFQPDYAQFTGDPDAQATNPGVHVFLELQCGTLDCHGQIDRPFRLFSQNGLRAESDAGNVSGGAATTTDEIYSNYLSAVGLEPEEMSLVVAGQAAPTSLLLVEKPRDLVHHKGGQRMVEGDPLNLCLTGWLADPSHYQGAMYDPNSCYQASILP